LEQHVITVTIVKLALFAAMLALIARAIFSK
jgi:hypothetical protein